eukprot:m.23933 g.23933  ORF g.23933 m.23933 type:complete len:415 (-) comp11118_c0_seq1:118-1362(-)
MASAAPTSAPAAESELGEVHVLETDRRSVEGSEFLVFEVTSRFTDGNPLRVPSGSHSQWRRFSDFELLWRYLQHCYPQAVIPPLPEKKVNFKISKMSVDKFDPEFVDKRRTALAVWLGRLLKHPILHDCKAFHAFLTLEDWKEELTVEVDGQRTYWTPSVVDDKVKAISASMKTKFFDKRFQTVRVYADSLQEKLTQLLNSHGKLARQTQELFLQFEFFESAFKSWMEVEKENAQFAGHLQKVAEYMDSLETRSNTRLRAEEEFADKLKEYIFFCEALREVARKQEIVQCEYEKALALRDNKGKELAELEKPAEKGLSGFFNRLKNLTPEERQAKVGAASAQLAALEEALTHAKDDVVNFADFALKDIERFHAEKVQDLKRLFLRFVAVQKRYCQQTIEAWTALKTYVQASSVH